MILIVAVDKNFGIGKNNELLTYLPNDLNYFKEKTLNKTLILGRKTLESFKNQKPLPKRRHIVFSRDAHYEKQGIEVVGNLEEAMSKVSHLDKDEVFVIGGGMIYALMLPYCDTAYVTKLQQSFDADVFLPNLDAMPHEWKLSWESELQHENGVDYTWTKYIRINDSKQG